MFETKEKTKQTNLDWLEQEAMQTEQTWMDKELKWLNYMWRHSWRYQEYYKNNIRKVHQKNHDYYQKHRERLINQVKEYIKNNPLKVKESNKKSRLRYIEERKKSHKEYYFKNKELIKQKRKEYREKNKDKIKISKKLEFLKHKDKYYKYKKDKYQNDINFKIACNLRNRLNCYLRCFNIPKDNKYKIKWNEIIEYLLKILPSNFNPKLYHIDHIKPLCSFDLTKEDELKKAFAPENHQWLLASENMKKAKYDRLQRKENGGN